MLRFVIVAVLLLVLVIFYAARLGDDEEPARRAEPPADAGAGTSIAPDEAPVAEVIPDDESPEDWFPDLTDRNDLPGIDRGVEVSRSTFGCDIGELTSELVGSRLDDEEQLDSLIGTLLGTLAASGDAELQLAAALLGDAAEVVHDGFGEQFGPMASVERAFTIDPMNPLVLWSAARGCGFQSADGFCSDPQLQANIRTVLSGNGEYWVGVAASRSVEGDKAGALEALVRAAAAPQFDNYLMANVRMLQRGISMMPDTNYIQQTLAAYALAQEYTQVGLGSVCGNLAPTDVQLLDVCLEIAGRYASEGRSISQQRTGTLLESQLYEVLGQSDAAEAASAKTRELREIRQILDDDVIAVMVTDERVLALFLEEMEAGNEASAMRFFREEVDRLKQDPNYHPCPPDDAPIGGD